MSTNCNISILKKDKTVSSIYCHSDGYLSYLGVCLYTYYDDVAKVKQLISLGNLSSLDKNIEPTIGSNHYFNNREQGICTFYGRDRKESNQDCSNYPSLEEFLNNYPETYTSHTYLFKESNQKWYVYNENKNKFHLLKSSLKKLESPFMYFKDDFLQKLDFEKIQKNYNQLNKEIPILDTIPSSSATIKRNKL